ncbi:hypothetical protein [Roseimarinus sediminis]|uniref:hypothetical protein n=1 Tax=Roseimarinus sediminis TaxID=1610899 RepID=UPI003D19C2CE
MQTTHRRISPERAQATGQAMYPGFGMVYCKNANWRTQIDNGTQASALSGLTNRIAYWQHWASPNATA